MKSAGYNDSVFINCPFDNLYATMLQAVVFAIYRCGFFPITALNEDNALNNRLKKIEGCIMECRYGIHDISRIELNINNLPRFNMPFELGMFFGAQRFGDKQHKLKNALIFDSEQYRYQQFISDLNGVDIKVHSNDPLIAIRKIRTWLNAASRRRTIPGTTVLLNEYNQFILALPDLLINSGLSGAVADIDFNDYCLIVEEYLSAHIH